MNKEKSLLGFLRTLSLQVCANILELEGFSVDCEKTIDYQDEMFKIQDLINSFDFED